MLPSACVHKGWPASTSSLPAVNRCRTCRWHSDGGDGGKGYCYVSDNHPCHQVGRTFDPGRGGSAHCLCAELLCACTGTHHASAIHARMLAPTPPTPSSLHLPQAKDPVTCASLTDPVSGKLCSVGNE